ncbi:prefoldin subunit alpha [Candidatus Korarchaeum cryptofilum]|jgi:prefoldin subunit 5|uniref:Prefoldin alpha domain protein n=1 Tax=Korarchaeum cryptofilum (strain OPF8) TaxID=374847 RepID=B1L6J6_KORCO|nr:prefoldin subunit alpha [Candidatus Korarchaeum cryptofilum]ACB08075.1 Prefoldin alpha domain protein [Candidatus Korarchaeum cryptofilum OPF8]
MSEDNIAFLQSLYRYLLDEYNRLNLLKSDLERSIETLKALSKSSEESIGPLILPISTFISLFVEAAKAREVLVLMGGNVYAKMGPEEALKQMKERLEEVNEGIREVSNNLAKVQIELENAQRMVRRAR